MLRARMLVLPALVLAVAGPARVARAQQQAGAPIRLTHEQAERARNAMTAAPAPIAAGATIYDWPANPTDSLRTLRVGTNGWACFPDMPMTKGNDPMCADDQWMNWMQAYKSKTAPSIQRIGFAYMLAPGGSWGSNTDPYATGETPDNQWGFDPPHVMMLVPDLKVLEGLPITRTGGGPWVMYPGTPYAHIMIPIDAPKK